MSALGDVQDRLIRWVSEAGTGDTRSPTIVGTVLAFSTAPTYFPIVNASTTDFTHPFAMTIKGNPTHKRFLRIRVRHLTGNPTHVPANQLWGSVVLN
jgi:hypothetical protein